MINSFWDADFHERMSCSAATVTLLETTGLCLASLSHCVLHWQPSCYQLIYFSKMWKQLEPSYGVCLEVPSKRGTPKSWVSIPTCSNFCFRNPYFRKPPCGKSCYSELLSSFCSQQTTAPKAGHSPSVPDAFQLFFMISVEKPRVGKATRSTPEICTYIYIISYIYIYLCIQPTYKLVS